MAEIQNELKKLADPKKATGLARFFKTGKGEYGAGDKFIGVIVPNVRKVVGKFWREIDLKNVEQLLHSPIHEERQAALFILVKRFKKMPDERDKIYRLYIKNTKYINNWDLVDLTAPRIVGGYLIDKPHDLLYKFAYSKDLWQKRIAVLATFWFIRENDFKDALKIAKILLNDKHDLIHKAVGWMLREIGKRNLAVEEKFLEKHAQKMPRTMLRYAIEKFPETKRRFYLGR